MVYYPDDHLKSEQNPVIQVTGCMTDDLNNGLLAIPMVAGPQRMLSEDPKLRPSRILNGPEFEW